MLSIRTFCGRVGRSAAAPVSVLVNLYPVSVLLLVSSVRFVTSIMMMIIVMMTETRMKTMMMMMHTVVLVPNTNLNFLQVEREGFPCSCGPQCANPEGRREFDETEVGDKFKFKYKCNYKCNYKCKYKCKNKYKCKYQCSLKNVLNTIETNTLF